MMEACSLCFRHCSLKEGETGACRARGNRGGRIVCLNYGQISSMALDPVEKKPFRRYLPGAKVLSVGSFGCNLHCPFCQNHEISMAGQGSLRTVLLTPEALAGRALALCEQGNIGLAYTYNEPLVGYEYVADCAALVHKMGMKNLLVTNGTVEEAPFRALLPLIDAANIDLKGFTGAFYQMAGGDFASVRRSIELAADACHLEVTTLIIPGINDGEEEIRALSRWLASLRPDIPLHITRFFPQYRMQDASPTPAETVLRLADVAGEALCYVYPGNLG